jgi:hypothetical protein
MSVQKPAPSSESPKVARVRVRANQVGYHNDRLYAEDDEFLMLTSAMEPAPGRFVAGQREPVIVTTSVGDFALPFWVDDAKIPKPVETDEDEDEEGAVVAAPRAGRHTTSKTAGRSADVI